MPLRLCLFGASDDTGNLGVSALLRGVLAEVTDRAPDAEVVVFDHGRGAGDATARLGGRTVAYRRVGAPSTRRVQRHESFARLAAGAMSHLPLHAGSAVVREADAVLAIAGGDSFADLYGRRRLRSVTAPMHLALRLRRPLVLLPQTYGPYADPVARREASELVRRADLAWARDLRGHAALLDLAGIHHDPRRHRLGIDVAYALPPAPDVEVEARYGSLATGAGELVGINVSGLLASGGGGLGPGRAAAHRAALLGLGRHVLETDRTARILVVPHVVGPTAESDEPACAELADALGPRAVAVPGDRDPGLVKALVARTTWFCGARMHATIAALSSGVPAAAVAYSDKFAGAFAEVGRAHHVADARIAGPDGVLDTLVDSYERRLADRGDLQVRASHGQVRARLQFDDILAAASTPAARVPVPA